MQSNHTSVMTREAIQALGVKQNTWYVDATFGGGGHTREILQNGGNCIAFDFDQLAIERTQAAFEKEIAAGTLILVRENFNMLQITLEALQSSRAIGEIAGVLYDFGTSADQLTSGERGFSFAGDGMLDMRMDDRLGVTAKDILVVVPERQLAELFAEYGGEQDAKRIARAIKTSKTPIETAQDLTALIMRVKGQQRSKLHPATKVFQALRIAVNSELDNIRESLPQALESLQPGGKIVTIAFHDGEDRVAKQLFATWEEKKLGSNETKKPIAPSAEEVQSNPRSRSAKMRVFVKA